jgi:hypothetical protein
MAQRTSLISLDIDVVVHDDDIAAEIRGAEGVARAKSDPAAAKRAIGKFTQTDDPKVIDEYDFYAPIGLQISLCARSSSKPGSAISMRRNIRWPKEQNPKTLTTIRSWRVSRSRDSSKESGRLNKRQDSLNPGLFSDRGASPPRAKAMGLYLEEATQS